MSQTKEYIVASFENFASSLLDQCAKNIDTYADVKRNRLPWSTIHRMNMENAYRACEDIIPLIHTKSADKLDKLLSTKNKLTSETSLFTMGDEKEHVKIAMCDGSKVVNVSCSLETIDCIECCLKHMEEELFKSDVNIGYEHSREELLQLVKKPDELKRFVRQNHKTLDKYFKILSWNWQDSLYEIYLLKAFPFDLDEGLQFFKRYMEKYQSGVSDCTFSELITSAKINPIYRNYLLGDFAITFGRNRRIVCTDWRYLVLDLELLKIYHKIFMETAGLLNMNGTPTEVFVRGMASQICSENLDNPSDLSAMFVFLFGLVSINTNNQYEVLKYCEDNKLDGYDVNDGLLLCGIVKLTDNDVNELFLKRRSDESFYWYLPRRYLNTNCGTEIQKNRSNVGNRAMWLKRRKLYKANGFIELVKYMDKYLNE
jgi:hypothetical protein